jgi:hypothetical protein
VAADEPLTASDHPTPPAVAASTPSNLPPPPPLRPPVRTAGSHAQYEFGVSENAILRNLGSKMSFVGLFMLGSGLFYFVSVLLRWFQSNDMEVGLLFLTLLFVVVGIWTHRAGREFRKVAETQGNDISHLMDALASMLKFYTLLYILFFIVLVFAIIQLGAHSLYGILPGDPAQPAPVVPPGIN